MIPVNISRTQAHTHRCAHAQRHTWVHAWVHTEAREDIKSSAAGVTGEHTQTHAHECMCTHLHLYRHTHPWIRVWVQTEARRRYQILCCWRYRRTHTHTHTHTHLGACMGAHRDQKKIPEPMLLALQEDVSCLTQVKQELLTAESLLSLLQGS